jgi:hypothetical protein
VGRQGYILMPGSSPAIPHFQCRLFFSLEYAVVDRYYAFWATLPQMRRASRLSVVEQRLAEVEATQRELTCGQAIQSGVESELRERATRRRARVRDGIAMLASLGGMTLLAEAIIKVVG